jgi:hypothetical protein
MHRVVLAALKSQFVPPTQVDSDQLEFAINATETLSVTKKGKMSPADLAKRWHIGVETAKKTLARTTQLVIRDYTHSMGGRRLKPFTYQLRYRRLNAEMYTATLVDILTSLQAYRWSISVSPH